MYNEDLIRVCKIDNGFIVEVREESKKEGKGEPCCPEYKQFACKTVEEAGKLVAKWLPLASGKTMDDEFGEAFEEASEINDAMDEEMDDEGNTR